MTMVACFNGRSMFNFGRFDAKSRSENLRYQALRACEWTGSFYDDTFKRETDIYDASYLATHFVCVINGIPAGSARLLRTDKEFMTNNGVRKTYLLQDVFSGRVNPDRPDQDPEKNNLVAQGIKLPHSIHARDFTRHVTDPTFANKPGDSASERNFKRNMRNIIVAHLMDGVVEFCINPAALEPKTGSIDELYSIMNEGVWARFGERGFEYEFLGPAKDVSDRPGEEDIVRAGRIPVSKETLTAIRKKSGITRPVINYGFY